MRQRGWYRDPFGTHDERWFSDGEPTNLVRDQGSESYGELPRDLLPEWRWWTVFLPGLLALAVSGLFIVYAGLASAWNCQDGCSPVTEGMPVGTAGEIAVAIAVVALLTAGLATPGWRLFIASALWVAFVFACGSAALIATARPAASAASAGQPSVALATPSLDAAACTAIGGRVLPDSYLCYSVPFLGSDGQRYYGSVGYGPGGQLTGSTDTSGMGATRSECESGTYNGPAGPVTRRPGRWNTQLSLCMP